ncbi:CHASE domain-containing protein [Lysobacter korlensis]|uniref:histidine kinase n=1 Tax=Lysobacter korlensis TaxID=553636 RepID=A0ABV6RQQ4_9GAMM
MDASPDIPRSSRFEKHFLPHGGHLLALAVLIGALVLVFATWHSVRQRELRAAEARFIATTAEVADLLQQRLVQYELVTRGGAALFASVNRPTPQQWASYVEGMDIGTRFPAMLGLGYAAYVDGGRIGDLQLEWRDAGNGMLAVFPRGVREVYGPVLYLEPRSPANQRTIGFDMFSEPTRGAALQTALETGRARLTGPVQLLQDGPLKATGLLLYLPVYRGGEQPADVEARRMLIQGWVYVPFRMRQFVASSLGNIRPNARFRIYDVTGGNEVLLFTNAFGQSEETPAFRYSRRVELYGRDWRIDFDSPPIAVAAPRMQALQNTLALGIVASLLMYAVAWMLAQTEARARIIASRLTEDYRRSEQRFRGAMQYSAIGMVLLDSQGLIVEANPAMGRIIGRDPAALAGTPFRALFDEDEVRRGEATPLPAETGDVRRTTRRFHHEDGIPRHVQLTYASVPGNVGQDVAGLVQVEDVTERLRAEARVHALNRTLEARVALRTRELSQANQELESFAYSVSHDLRAPLRAIEGFGRILSERYGAALDDSGRDYLGRVRRAASRMGELIDAMLKMSRLTRGELKPEAVDLSRMAQEIGEELRAEDPQREVEFVVQLGLAASGDPALLRNLLSNLLGNAWKFTRGRDAARVEFGLLAETDEFFVRDNGAGFSQAYVDKLFRPFQRLHSQEQFAGHGIGLATVKRIVERHGGTIRAEGAEGQGAMFRFTLPGDAAHDHR